MQCPPDAGAAFARRAIRAGGWQVRLLSLRRWLRGVARGLRRLGQLIEPRLQGGDASVLRGNVLSCVAIRWSANASLAVSAAMSVSFSAWLSAGVGSRGTRRVEFDSGVTVSRSF